MPESARDGRRRFTTGVSEMLLIVASILLAFALDSWWDQRADAAAHRELARLLHADFSETQELLRGVIERGEFRVARGEALMAALDDPRSAGTDSIQDLFEAVWRPVQTVPLPVSYRTAMASGVITLLDEPGLFRALGRLDEAQARVQEYRDLSAEIHYLGAMAELEHEIGSMGVLLGNAFPDRFETSDYLSLVSQPSVYSASRLAVQANRNTLGNLRFMDDALTGVIQELEATGFAEE